MKHPRFTAWLCSAAALVLLAVPAFAQQPDALPPEDAPAAQVQTAPADVPSPTAETAQPAPDAEPPAADPQRTYVALGDSIVSGVGLPDFKYTEAAIGMDVAANFEGYPEQCYVSLVGKGLGLDRQHAINLGLPGVMSKDMLELVKTGTMAEMNTLSGCQYNYPEFVDYIKSADVISIQLGSNDAFVPTVVSFGEATNWKSEDLASIVLSGNLRGSSKETEDALNESLKKLSLTRSEKDAVWNLFFSGMNKICENAYPESSSNLRQIVATVKELNPDAQILIIGATNPVPLLPSWSNYFSKLNNYEKQLADVYGATYVSIPFAQTELDGHPTVSGHKYIADKIVKAIEAQQ